MLTFIRSTGSSLFLFVWLVSIVAACKPDIHVYLDPPNLKEIEKALDDGRDIDAYDWSGFTPLQNLASRGVISSFSSMMGNPCDNQRDQKSKEYKAAQFLIKRGAGIDLKDEDNDVTALHLAARHCFYHMAALLIKSGASQNVPDADGETAYDNAVSMLGSLRDEKRATLADGSLEADLKAEMVADLNGAIKGYKRLVRLLSR